jgi:protein-disulfide isomerase
MRTIKNPLMGAVICCLLLVICQHSKAQATGTRSSGPTTDNSLRAEMRSIEEQQQQILSTLREIKQFLHANDKQEHSQPPNALDIHGESFRGDNNASVAIVEYADFECPYCGQFARQVYPQISDKYIMSGKVKYFYRDLPFHPHAMSAARAARCAGDQGKYWELHDSLFAKQAALSDTVLLDHAKSLGLDTNKFSECLSSDRYTDDVRKGVSEGQALGIDGTPTFFVGTIDPDGNMVKITARMNGTGSYETFASTLDAALAAKSQEAVSAH